MEDLKREISIFKEQYDKCPDSLYSVMEIRTDLQPGAVPIFSKPTPPGIVVSPSVSIYPEVDILLDSDDSYNQLPKPDKSTIEKVSRIDDNFVVKERQVWW